MNHEILIVPLERHYLSRIESWANQDASKILLKQPGIGSATYKANEMGWVALMQGEPIAVITIEHDSNNTYRVDILVKPSERRRGIGSKLLNYAMQQPTVRAIHGLRALAEPDNTAGQKILTREGFTKIGSDADGRLVFEKH